MDKERYEKYVEIAKRAKKRRTLQWRTNKFVDGY